MRKGYASLDELELVQHHSKRGASADAGGVEGMYGGGEGSRYNMMEPQDIGPPHSFTSANPQLSHLRLGSPGRYSPAGGLRMSPSRGNLTDSELLSSPTQVLYATISADKHRHTNVHNNNLKNQNTASQTVQTGFRPVSVDRHMKARASSKENILDELPHYRHSGVGSGGRGSSPAVVMNNSRSLDRHMDSSDKENRRQELKARIHVTSPNRYTPERQLPAVGSRKPYKTTINTATDTIQYRGFSSENLSQGGNRGGGADGHYYHRNQFAHSGRRLGDSEHYKVPRNKAPVPTAELLARRPMAMGRTDSENSSSVYNGSYYAAAGHPDERGPQAPQQFASTSLVRNVVESRHKRSEYDREGRRIQSERRSASGPAERSRAYSGYSTSPDRETSPERYAARQNRSMAAGSRLNLARRSPSSSPTRPPRMRTTGGEVRREHSGRHVERTPSTRAAATSRSPIKKIQRVHNEIQYDKQPGEQSVSTRVLPRARSGEGGAGSGGARGVKSLLLNNSTSLDRGDKKKILETSEDRLAKFTEYRGSGDEEELDENSAVDGRGGRIPSAPRPQRRGSHSVGGSGIRDVRRDSDLEAVTGDEREQRGQSVPPGANIDSMREFYKTNQYRSMYHLPPSPSRPAPILDRVNGGGSTKTLERFSSGGGGMLRRERSSGDGGQLMMGPQARSSRPARTSVSEGELTDDQARQERVLRQRSRFLNSTLMMGKLTGGGEQSPAGRRRLAGGHQPVSNSLDRGVPAMEMSGAGRHGAPRATSSGGGVVEGRRQHSREGKRPAPQPPTQRVRRSSVDMLETSMSESESPRQEKVSGTYVQY